MARYEAERIFVRYGDRPVLDDVSLSLAPGELIALVGPNGAGKSTLLRTLAGDLRAAAGVVRIGTTDIRTLRPAELAARRGVLPQSSTLGFPFTVHEVVRLGLAGLRHDRRASELVAAALDRVDLGAFGGRHYHELSGGERQRVHLARVLCQVPDPSPGEAPRYLFLDEPTSGLDLKHQMLILDIARGFAAAGGGVLAVLHDLNLAASYADRIAVVCAGRIAALGAPAEVITDGMIRAVFDVDVEVSATPAKGTPFVLPQAIRRGN
ncbi:MAG: heme ABC transporter ATP-binding protein [Bauldia sp.]